MTAPITSNTRGVNVFTAPGKAMVGERSKPFGEALQTSIRHHVYSTGGFSCLQKREFSRLNTLVGGPSKVFEASYAQIHEAIRALVKRAIKSGDMRKDFDPVDLLRALIGVSNAAASPDWPQSSRRLVDILITGSRPIK